MHRLISFELLSFDLIWSIFKQPFRGWKCLPGNYEQTALCDWLLQSGAQPLIQGNWIYNMENHVIIMQRKLHSSELYSNLISSQTVDDMLDFPSVQQTVGSAELNTCCCYRRVSSRDNQGETLEHRSQIFPGNNYSISSKWEATWANDAQNMCSVAMLCCSSTADPSCWYSTCHFLRAGEYSSNTGDLYERETTRRDIITSPFNVHTRPHMHTHTNLYYTLANPAHCAHVWQLKRVWRESACPTTQDNDQFPFINTFKHVAHSTPAAFTTTPIKQYVFVTTQPKYSPCSSLCNKSPAKATSDLQHNYSKFKARPG